MRTPFKHHFFIPLNVAFLVLAATAADAAVQIDIDKNTQTMTVSVDGAKKWTWPVSSGLPNYETPNGTFRAFRMEADHFSKEWDDAPMPHSIFFTKLGHAIHGTDASRRLGVPASHGCVRLSREHAAELYALVEQQGVLNTTVTLTGSSQVALARAKQSPTELANANSARQPLGITPRGGQSADDDALASDPSDYQRVPPPQTYDQDYQGGYGTQTYRPRSAYVARGYIQQPYAQQGYAQQDGYYQQRSQSFYGQSYPNYPGYNRAPQQEYYSW